MFLGALFALTAFIGGAPANAAPVPTPSKALMIGIAIAAPVVGAVVGAVFGGLQALVLRKAARGLGAWVGFSTVGVVVVAALLFVVAFYVGAAAPGRDLANALLFEAVAFIGMLAGAIVMLPAVNRLTPR